MPRPRLEGTIVITGASSGIGAELARGLALRAKQIVLVARREDRLRSLASELLATRSAGLSVHVMPCDLESSTARQALFERITAEVGVVDVLINNAGFGDAGFFEDTDAKKLERMIALNVTALVDLSRRFYESMAARKSGSILNISSGFGLQTSPGFATYVGTKHFVTGFTESLHTEAARLGVVVSQACPGPVRTEFGEVAALEAFGPQAPAFLEQSASACARNILSAFGKGRALIYPGFVIQVLLFFGAITPRWVLRAANRLVAKRVAAHRERRSNG